MNTVSSQQTWSRRLPVPQKPHFWWNNARHCWDMHYERSASAFPRRVRKALVALDYANALPCSLAQPPGVFK